MTQRKQRNSSIELLRIIAMVMIVAHHYVDHSTTFVSALPPFSGEEYFYLCMRSLGKLGVMLFFSISAWYLCMERHPTARKGLKRAWLLEREVLFYSLVLVCVCNVLLPNLTSTAITVKSCIPTASGIWWYVTAYMIFVLVAPFLTNGLRRLGKQSHAALCVILMVMWGIVAGLSPIPLFHMQYDGLVSFLFLYTVISFYRWYMDDMTTKSAVLLVIIGCICIFGSILLMQLLGTRLHSVALRNMSNFLTSNSVKLPIMMVGFGILVLAERKVFHNSCINAIASTTFAIYLISDYPPVRTALWNSRFGLAAVYGAHDAILISLASIFVVCITCMIVDFMRQFLFTMTVDRHPGAWFDKLSEFVVTRHSLQQIAQSIAEKPTPHEHLFESYQLDDQADEPIPRTESNTSR